METLNRLVLDRVNRNAARGCWEWQGLRNRDGYGLVTIAGKQWLTHRYAYHILCREVDRSVVVRHECDNPCCVNPTHLIVGTQADNIRDMVSRGRNVPPRGERHGSAKLTEDDVRVIRRRCESGERQAAVALDYNLKPPAVQKIVSRRRWKHVV